MATLLLHSLPPSGVPSLPSARSTHLFRSNLVAFSPARRSSSSPAFLVRGHSSPDNETPKQSGWSLHIGTGVMIALTVFQLTASVPIDNSSFNGILGSAEAVLYSPDTKVPRSADVALRRAIPHVNSATKNIQDSLEDIFYLLRIPQRKPYGTMESDVKKAIKLATEDKDAILATVPGNERERAAQIFDSLTSGKGGLQALLDAIADKDPDKVSVRLVSSLESVAQLELLQAPGLPFLVPTDYQKYPRLTGRATVEFFIKRADGSTFTVAAGGGPKEAGTIERRHGGHLPSH